jgi:putative transposase
VTILPRSLRRSAAKRRREAERAGLPPGEYCEELDRRYLAAKPKLRAEAECKAAMARKLAKARGAGLSAKARYAEVRAEFGKVSDEALRDIERRIEGVAPANYAAVLLRDQKGGPAPVECDPRAWEMLKADFLRPEAPAFTACFDRMMDAAKARGWAPIPTERTLRRRLEREVPKEAQVLARKGRKALQQLLPAQRRDRSGFAPCQAVNADGHTFDVFVTAPWRPKPFRPVLVAVQDLYSGMILGWRLGETECWPLVRLAFLDVLRNHGVPERAFLDNGRSFASKWMTCGQLRRFRFKVKEGEPQGLLASVGMTVSWTTPYHGQAKPIERAFRDLCETISKHPACAGAYTGNSPAAKPENYGRRAVEWEAFKALVAAEIARHNARPGRKAANCALRSFEETYATAAAEAVIAKAAPSQLLKFQLAADRVRSRAPSGEVHPGGNRYWAEPLINLAGKDVVVRFDPEALKAGVHVFLPDGRFVAEAPCIDDAGFDDAEAAAQHARQMAEDMRRVRAGLEAERRMTPAQVAALLPDAPAPAPAPEPAAVRMVAGGRPVAAETEPGVAPDAWSRAIELLDRGVIRYPSRRDGDEDRAETTRTLDRMAATAGRGKSA